MKNKGQNFIVYYLVSILLFLQLSGPLLDGGTFLFAGDQTCSEKLDMAEEYYYDDAFDEAQALIQVCLNDPALEQAERIRAYTILTRVFLARGNMDAAKEIVLKMLAIDPAYQPTIEQETPRYVNFVADVKKEFKPPVLAETLPKPEKSEKKSGKRWLWIGAGGATAIAIIAVLALGSDDEPTEEKLLSTPPPFPQ